MTNVAIKENVLVMSIDLSLFYSGKFALPLV